jgi:hypothetical protein
LRDKIGTMVGVIDTTRYCWRTLKEGFIVLLIGSEYVQLK